MNAPVAELHYRRRVARRRSPNERNRASKSNLKTQGDGAEPHELPEAKFGCRENARTADFEVWRTWVFSELRRPEVSQTKHEITRENTRWLRKRRAKLGRRLRRPENNGHQRRVTVAGFCTSARCNQRGETTRVVPERSYGKGGSKGGSRAFQGAQLGAANRKCPRFLGLRLAMFESWSGSRGKKGKVGEWRLTRGPRVCWHFLTSSLRTGFNPSSATMSEMSW